MKLTDEDWERIKKAGDECPSHIAPFKMADALDEVLDVWNRKMLTEDFRQFLSWMLAADEKATLLVLNRFRVRVYEKEPVAS